MELLWIIRLVGPSKFLKKPTFLCAPFLPSRGRKKVICLIFIERTVLKEILARTAADVKRQNADLSRDELAALIDEAVNAVRTADMRTERDA